MGWIFKTKEEKTAKRREAKQKKDEEKAAARAEKERLRERLVIAAEVSFPDDFPEPGDKLRVTMPRRLGVQVYDDKILVLDCSVVNRQIIVDVDAETSAINTGDFCYVLELSYLHFHGRIGDQDFIEIMWNDETERWLYTDDKKRLVHVKIL